MGCWNGTCGLSRVGILSGQKVKLVIIKNNVTYPEAAGFCYSSGYANPMSFIIEGQYNDYGSLENIQETTSVLLFKKHFNNELEKGNIKVSADNYYDNEMNTQDGNYQNLSIENIINLIERDRVTIKTRFYKFDEDDNMEQGSEFVLLGFMMFHNTVFERVQSEMFIKTPEYEGDYSLSDIIQDCEYAVEDLFSGKKPRSKQEVRKLMETLKENGSDKNSPEMDILVKELFAGNNDWKTEIRKVKKWNNIVATIRGNEGSDTAVFRTYFDMMQEDILDLFGASIMLANYVTLLQMMDALRVFWSGQTGKGSQSFEIDAYIGLTAAVDEIVEQYKSDCDWE